tara:strand:+ start:1665 stop:2102 length:438 start_codon:yes stop_codon:yes gene_type:complete
LQHAQGLHILQITAQLLGALVQRGRQLGQQQPCAGGACGATRMQKGRGAGGSDALQNGQKLPQLTVTRGQLRAQLLFPDRGLAKTGTHRRQTGFERLNGCGQRLHTVARAVCGLHLLCGGLQHGHRRTRLSRRIALRLGTGGQGQ